MSEPLTPVSTDVSVPQGLASRPCSWCAASVPQLRRPGRPRLYCNHACRQRAYEHRHGLLHARTVRDLPGQDTDGRSRRLGTGTGYERGGRRIRLDRRVHALRPAVRPDGRRRETLCGLLADPNPGKWFSTAEPGSCLTCRSVAAKNPLRSAVDPSYDLARLRAVIDEAVEDRLEPTAALRWLWANAPDPRPAPPHAA